jgi:guanosine-3',5'-bis(diphosphate) 3'-pyrophosphohydrolase
MPLVTLKQPTIVSIDDVLATAQENNKGVDVSLVREAYIFARDAHGGQRRKTGEEYIQHPLHVANTIAELGLGTSAIVAALLHDVREDTAPAYYEQIASRFGEAVNFLVQGVTKLSKIRKLRENTGSIEDLRNIFLAMTRDIRVIIIKLADRLHNLQTLQGHDRERQLRIAQQTLDIYAPIADRLGMGEMKGQLADLAFRYAMPREAELVRSLVKEAYAERVAYCNALKEKVREELVRNEISVIDVHGRAKRLYSLYLKMQRYNNDVGQIYDLVALRVLVPTLEDCYQALGAIHRRWKPLMGKIKDYCATPKANGYQSLHTTVIMGDGKFLEIQIRTPEMHERAEYGVAAAWAYADAKRVDGRQAAAAAIAGQQDLAWVKQLAHWQHEVDNPEEFFQSLRTDFFKNRIFCLTPAGEVIDLPDGATPVDFGYLVHTSIGHRAVSAKVNGKKQPLDYQLGNGDLVEIICGAENRAPRREWLDFVKTTTARKQIKAWYTQLDKATSTDVGRDLLARELKQLAGETVESLSEQDLQEYLRQQGYGDFKDLLTAIGRGERNPRQVVKRLYAEQLFGENEPLKRHHFNVRIVGAPGVTIRRAHCCRPIEGDKIVAALAENRATIHRDECRQLKDFVGTKMPAEWMIEPQRSYRLWLEIHVKTYVGMLRDTADVCAQNKIAIHDAQVRRRMNDYSNISLLVEIRDTDQLSELMRKLRALPKVESVTRRHS